MTKNKLFRSLTPVLLLAAFSACKKVIHVNINSTASQYVVEGNITDQPGPYVVTISKSINFDQDNVWPTVSGAIVVVTDVTANQVDTLAERTQGSYSTNKIIGAPGHTYNLYVNVANHVFTASSTMPAIVTFDSLYAQANQFRADRKQLVPIYKDPSVTGTDYHYYHFTEFINDSMLTDVLVRKDDLISGQVLRMPIGSSELVAGDSVTLYMECIDANVYKYYSTLSQTENQNSASPANPLTNLTGGALGYFSAHTSSHKAVIVQ